MKKVLISVVVIAILFSLYYLNDSKVLLYPLERIKGTYSIKMNNKKIAPIDEYYEYGMDGKVRLSNDTTHFEIKSGDYGRHKIGFVLSGEELYQTADDPFFLQYDDIDLSVIYFKTNSWSMADIDIEINILKEQDEWYVNYAITWKEKIISDYEGQLSKKIKFEELKDVQIIFGI